MLQKHASRKEIMQTLCIAGHDAGKRAKNFASWTERGTGERNQGHDAGEMLQKHASRKEIMQTLCIAGHDAGKRAKNFASWTERGTARGKGHGKRKGARQEERSTGGRKQGYQSIHRPGTNGITACPWSVYKTSG